MAVLPPRGVPISRRTVLKAAGLGIVAVAGSATLAELLSSTTSEPAATPGGLTGLAALGPAAGAAAALGPAAASPDPRRHFVSRPDITTVPVSVHVVAPEVGLPILFTPNNGVAPDRPMIVTPAGEPVWVAPPTGKQAVNLRVATYRGEPVLTWWEGSIVNGLGQGEYVIADASYAEIQRIRAADGLLGDLHEFVISPDDTALFLVANPVSGVIPYPSGATSGPVVEAVIQEIDIATGRLLFEWHSLPEIDPDESYLATPADGSPFDYLHANSIDIAPDGDLLLSGRHTWAVYKIGRASAAVRWRLNGRRSDFAMGPGAAFAWQHDARAHGDRSISIFDDGAMGPPPQFETQSRGIVLGLDMAAMTARLVEAFVHPDRVLATSQGNLQLLGSGGAFVGWGKVPRFSEFNALGALVFDASFEVGQQSYRAFRQSWRGQPGTPPAVVMTGDGDVRTVHVSWNGATEVRTWDVLGGESVGALASIGRGTSLGFETAIEVRLANGLVIARALDADGLELGRSDPVTIA